MPGVDRPVRTLVARCDDWPIAASGHPLHEPVAIVHANRVVAASPAARAEGVARHLRKREAQGRCPGLVVVAHDPARDARAFEPVVAALDAITARVEITVPGQVAFPTRGPVRRAGGDGALAAQVLAAVSTAVPEDVPVRVGVADGPFAAALATRMAIATPTRVVAPGDTPAFLADLPLTALEVPALVEVLTRLGLRTLGDLGALPGPEVLARFGRVGHEAWRLARGDDERPPRTAPPPADLTVAVELDPPAETVAPAAFAARGLAEELHRRLWARGSACTRVLIGAETEHGERSERVWRAEGALTAAAMADRLRWQLDGWLQGSARHRPSAGITRLWLAPDEVVPAGGRQLGFWGSDAATSDRAARAVARVQGLLGMDAVTVPEWRGARDPATAVARVDAASLDLTVERPDAHRARVVAPWPGRLPPPSPARVHHTPVPAELVDGGGARLRVSARGELLGRPARLSVGGGPWCAVVGWAGPWPLDERWWDVATHRRRARLQVLTADGPAHLLALERGTWHVESTYD